MSQSRVGPAEAIVIGVDIGTTSTKAVAFDTKGKVLASHSAGYELAEPEPGQAIQDVDEIYAAVLEAVRETVRGLADRTVRGLSFSAAMHSLIGLDPDGVSLTPVLTWADSRASAQAERLRAGAGGLRLHRRTGTPVHPMSPLTKLVWYREQEPKLVEKVRHWVGIKELVLLRMCDALVVDHSIASATGLLDIHRMEWDTEALDIAGSAGAALRARPHHDCPAGLTAAAARDTACRSTHRSWSAPVTARSRTSASGRWRLESRPAPSGQALRCASWSTARWSTNRVRCSASPSSKTGGSSGARPTTAATCSRGPAMRSRPTSAIPPGTNCWTGRRVPAGSGGLLMCPPSTVNGRRTGARWRGPPTSA